MILSHPFLFRYGLAVFASVAALVLRLLVRPYLDPSISPLFYLAVIVSAWIGGPGPGLLAALLSAFAFVFYTLPPADSPASALLRVILPLTMLTLTTLITHGLSTRARRRSERQLQERAKLIREETARAEAEATAAELRQMNEQLAAATVRAQTLVDEAETARQETAALLEATKRIARSLDHSTTLTTILDAANELAGSEFAGVALLDAGGEILRYEAYRGPAGLPLKEIRIRPGGSIAGRALQTGEPVTVPDLDHDRRTHAYPLDVQAMLRQLVGKFGFRSACAVPLRSREQVFGVLVALSRRPAHFAAPQERLLTGLADQAALAIEHARLFAEIGRLQAIRELDQLKSEFVETVSHELRTPLSLIYGYAELMLIRSFSPAEQRSMLEAIHEGAGQLSQLIDEVVEISRIEQGRLRLVVGVIDLRVLLTETVDVITAPNHRLVADLPTEPVLVQGDADRLRRVVLGLLSNAVHYSPDGGTICLRAAVAGDHVQVSVGDEGVGLTAEQLERVFERFYRAPVGERYRPAGIGLGLPICRFIVEAHGGRIWAESPGLGLGASFHFTLPLHVGTAQVGAHSECRGTAR